MEAIVERCCGLDVHQATVVACVLVGEPRKKPRKEVRTFGTMRQDLLALRAWLEEQGCTHVGMESTGIYWLPVYLALEGHFELVVGNATHIRNVPGRKTDVKDSEWIADLLRHGLIAKSFVPSQPIRELRDLTRYRRRLVESQTEERNRLIKVLEAANIKLATVASDVFGVSGMQMLRALRDGTSTPAEIAALARGRLRKKKAEIERAVDGILQEHHRYLIGIQLRRLEAVEQDIGDLDARIDEKLAPYRAQHERLTQIPGIDRVGATVIIAELGVDMNVFPTVHKAAAWAGVCPGNHESAGKKKSRGVRKGNVHLTTALVQAAVCASRKKGSYLKEKYWKLKARRGPKRAALAIAHKILVAAYYMLRDGVDYRDLGPSYLDRLSRDEVAAALVKRLQRMGLNVTVSTPTDATPRAATALQ